MTGRGWWQVAEPFQVTFQNMSPRSSPWLEGVRLHVGCKWYSRQDPTTKQNPPTSRLHLHSAPGQTVNKQPEFVFFLVQANQWNDMTSVIQTLESTYCWLKSNTQTRGLPNSLSILGGFDIYPYIGNYRFNPLNPELNPICYLLALLGAHHFLHLSRIRVKLLTFRLLMSYIYGAPILVVSRSHTTTQHSR